MAANRIKVAKDKATLVKALISLDETTGAFQTYADLIVFAAALGAKQKKRLPIEEISRKDPEPIPQEHFTSRGYEKVITLLAVTATQDSNILANNETNEETRIKIFEEYANAGLQILSEQMKGSVGHLERILLFLHSENDDFMLDKGEFDLSQFLPM